jgi:hypothetical protein
MLLEIAAAFAAIGIVAIALCPCFELLDAYEELEDDRGLGSLLFGDQ